MQSKITATVAATAAEDDYPCVRRLRHRRLLAYLHNHGFEAAFHSVIRELGQRQHKKIFSVAHLRKLVAVGRWSEALSYVYHLLPPPPGGVETRPLLIFLVALRTLANIVAAGSSHIAAPAEQRRGNLIRCSAKLSSIINTVLNSPLYRASLDWELVKQEAASVAYDLAIECPELSQHEVLRLPPAPHDMLLPVFRSCGRRRYLKKQDRRPTASAIARLCLGFNNKKSNNKKTSQPSSSGPLPGLDIHAALDRVADLIDKCLKAGKRPELHHQVQPLQPIRIQGLNQEELACILYVENHCRLNPNTILVDIGGLRLNAQNLKCLTIDKTRDGREKYIQPIVTNAYIRIISSRRANCILSKRFLVYNSGWSQVIPSIVSTTWSVSFLDHAKFLTQNELVFLPMIVEVHIIVLVVNNKSKEFQVLDSARTYSRYQSQINDTVRGIKYFLDKARSHGLHEAPDVRNWPVNLIYHLPRQEDGCSCSLFALKYIELWDGERLSISFNQSDIHSFRVQVLVELLLSDLNTMNDVKSELRRLLDEAK